MSRRHYVPDDRDEALISEVIGYLYGVAAALQLDRGLRSDSVTTPSPEGYAKLLGSRLKALRLNLWPIEG